MDSVGAESTPTTVELVELANAGLRTEKNMFPSKNGNHDMLYQGLVETYPKLKSQNGAFVLLKPESGGIKRPFPWFYFHYREMAIHYLISKKLLVPTQQFILDKSS